ncbi:uncharacterized protein LOC123904654 [Trifolium pratense]|uniref:uncharacterized protein LOC123904654 n=1 Tax=Trifolium pratense TaxID=57577 RepID=UPI001E691E5B|nr:uncharacterized protein LOC123904654 [Trifolium pratense]
MKKTLRYNVCVVYFNSKWRKDIRRRHTYIKCGFDHFVGNVELQRVDKACSAFYEVASRVINTEHDFLKMMNFIKDIKDEFTFKETSSSIAEDGSDQNQVTKILDPVKTRCKGRPPSNRKSSKADQIVKKLAKKRTKKNSQKSANIHAQKEKDMCASRVQESVQVIDRVGTQKSIQGEQSSFGRNEQGGVNKLAPFNPNSILIKEVNQVPFYSQVMNHGGSYFELLQAQHHVNDPSLSNNHTHMK